ncbi:MAG: SUMF1/EgtB/PvdO family nonheme iron enzyme [Deltaproteobacteria bacterium]|nr:SUMF1/EgtB/PvdO family nonheme iron enzyme [Deltaproteobacteria bacterium]
MKIHGIKTIISFIPMLTLFHCSPESSPCKFDTDCKGDKVCRNGSCVGLYENIDIVILTDISHDTDIHKDAADELQKEDIQLFADYETTTDEIDFDICQPECEDEGKRVCNEDGYLECINTSRDRICLKNVFHPCNPGDECRNGQCGKDECVRGDKLCVDSKTYKICEEDTHGFLRYITKQCDIGFSCNRSLCCPNDMVEIEGFCIDKYEAAVSLKPDCSTDILGQYGDNYPDSFPDNVDINTNPPSEKLFTCSIEGILPSRFITYNQAKTVCLLSGKRLCTKEEYIIACTGNNPKYKYPYGESYNNDMCNDFYQRRKDVTVTGSYIKCKSTYGVFDMSGNVEEWIESNSDDKNVFYTIGGYAGCNTLFPNGCSECSKTVERSNLTSNKYVGFRCCK